MDVWFKMDGLYPDHAKVSRLKRRLRQSLADVYPMRLMAYCARQARDGRIGLDLVEEKAGWTGRPGVLLEALRAEGFIDPDGSLHGWMERSGSELSRIEEERKAARERQARARAAKERHGDVTPESREHSRDVTVMSRHQTETETEKKNSPPSEGRPDGPPATKKPALKKDGTPRKPPWSEPAGRLMDFFEALCRKKFPDVKVSTPETRTGEDVRNANQIVDQYDVRRVAFAIVCAFENQKDDWYRNNMTTMEKVRNKLPVIMRESSGYWATIQDMWTMEEVLSGQPS